MEKESGGEDHRARGRKHEGGDFLVLERERVELRVQGVAQELAAAFIARGSGRNGGRRAVAGAQGMAARRSSVTRA